MSNSRMLRRAAREREQKLNQSRPAKQADESAKPQKLKDAQETDAKDESFPENKTRIKLDRKEIILTILATAIALASLPNTDPWVTLPMLALSEGTFVYLFVKHEGKAWKRLAWGTVITVILSAVGWRVASPAIANWRTPPSVMAPKNYPTTLPANAPRLTLERQFAPPHSTEENLPFAILNFTVENKGGGVSESSWVGYAWRITDGEKGLTDQEIAAMQEKALVEAYRVKSPRDQIYPNGKPYYVSFPQLPPDMQMLVRDFDNIKNRKKRLYLAVTALTIGDGISPTEVSVTDACMMFQGSFEMNFTCGKNRSYLDKRRQIEGSQVN